MTTPAGTGGRQIRGISIRWLLTGVIGGIVLTSMIVIYALGFWVAATNTRDLLQSVIEEAVERLVHEVRDELSPAAVASAHAARQISERGPPASDHDVELLRTSLTLAPQLIGGAFFHVDGSAVRYVRPGEHPEPDGWAGPVNTERWTGDPQITAAFDQIRADPRPTWVPPVLYSGQTLIIARHPVFRDGELLGITSTAVTTADLSRFVESLDSSGARGFVLYGRDGVLAHPLLSIADLSAFLSRDDPVFPVSMLGDKVLAAFRRGAGEPLWVLNGRRGEKNPSIDGRALRIDGTEYAVVWREVHDFGPTPWLIGAYVDIDREGSDALLDRLAAAAVLALVVILVSVVALHLIARRIREPIRALAELSHRVRSLDFGVEKVGEPTIVREINEANLAFGHMLAGLRWFETYVPKNLVLTLMRRTEETEVASEERTVTVMFTDIAGFTGIAETRTPGELANLLNTHFTLVNRCVEQEAGTVDKYIGDSVMAFWGAPEEQPDHARRACRAVEAVAVDLAAYNEKRRSRGREPIRMRIGLHSGPAIAGNIGSPGRINYTLVGDTVNIANRLEQLGKQVDPDGDIVILVSEETREFAGSDGFDFGFIGDHMLRGRREPTPVYRLTPPARSD